MKGVNFPDARLGQRLTLMVGRLAAQPGASIPQAMGTWADTKAAYRFLDSDRVSPDTIRAAHAQSCIERIAALSTVLIVQDTSTLDFTHHPATKGLGYLHASQRGLVMHTGLACTVEGVPLGVLSQDIWLRDLDALGKSEDRRKRPFDEKESAKWVTTLQRSTAAVPAHVQTVTIADSEADVFDLFAAERPATAQLLIRATRNRGIVGETRYLWAVVESSPVVGETSVNLKATAKREARTAHCSIRFQTVTVRPPRHPSPGSRHMKPVTLQAVLVREESPPKGVEPLCWLLLTTLAVNSFAEALRCVQWYRLRWIVERYHLVLKSGCRVERLQLETAERIERAVAVYSVVAWRLLWLTYEARRSPEASCEGALERHEWQALYCTIHKTSTPPAEPPTLRQAVRWIAQLGGFLGRKGDGEPGVIVLWRGLRRLEDIASLWLLLHPLDVGNG